MLIYFCKCAANQRKCNVSVTVNRGATVQLFDLLPLFSFMYIPEMHTHTLLIVTAIGYFLAEGDKLSIKELFQRHMKTQVSHFHSGDLQNSAAPGVSVTQHLLLPAPHNCPLLAPPRSDFNRETTGEITPWSEKAA